MYNSIYYVRMQIYFFSSVVVGNRSFVLRDQGSEIVHATESGKFLHLLFTIVIGFQFLSYRLSETVNGQQLLSESGFTGLEDFQDYPPLLD